MNEMCINKYRKQLMGMGAIGVWMVHSGRMIPWSYLPLRILTYGGTGVYIFVFLSAVGLYLSLKKHDGMSKLDFYKRRMVRVLIPYLFIAGTWYGVKYLMLEHNLWCFLYALSTWSFWMEHQGAWYVAMLIPVYLIFPWFYDWVEKGKSGRKLLGTGMVITAIAMFLCVFFYNIYDHLSQIFSSLITYLIGYEYAIHWNTHKKAGKYLSLLCVGLFLLTKVLPLGFLPFVFFINNITWSLLGIPILFLASWLLDHLCCKSLDQWLGFLGNYSLELYLWNIFLLEGFSLFQIDQFLYKKLSDSREILVYLFVFFCAVLLSIAYRWMIMKVSKIILPQS